MKLIHGQKRIRRRFAFTPVKSLEGTKIWFQFYWAGDVYIDSGYQDEHWHYTAVATKDKKTIDKWFTIPFIYTDLFGQLTQ